MGCDLRLRWCEHADLDLDLDINQHSEYNNDAYQYIHWYNDNPTADDDNNFDDFFTHAN